MAAQGAFADGDHTQTSSGLRRSLVVLACWFGLFAEGYDMGALGAVMPGLIDDPAWHLSAMTAGWLASAAIMGMFFGAYGFGVVSDRLGRKGCFIGCLGLFSLASGAAALAPTPWLFAVCRFVAGVGVGGIVPVCAALVYEFAPARQVNKAFALMYTGYSLGIFGAALSAFFLLSGHGWRFVLLLGAGPVLALPVLIRFLPESPVVLWRSNRQQAALSVARRFALTMPEGGYGQAATGAVQDREGLAGLLRGGRWQATCGFWLATLFGMVLVYGLNTWLPQIMRKSGYELGPSILFLGVFALSSSLGGVLLGEAADRLGLRKVIVCAFLLGAVAICALSHKWPLPVTYVLVALGGVGTVSAAVIVTSYVAHYFPDALRATAVGSSVSFSRVGAAIGPLLGGLVATFGLGVGWNFMIFSCAALAAAASMAIVPTRRAGADRIQDLKKEGV